MKSWKFYVRFMMSLWTVAKATENAMTSIYLAKFMFSLTIHKSNTKISKTILGSFRKTPSILWRNCENPNFKTGKNQRISGLFLCLILGLFSACFWRVSPSFFLTVSDCFFERFSTVFLTVFFDCFRSCSATFSTLSPRAVALLFFYPISRVFISRPPHIVEEK